MSRARIDFPGAYHHVYAHALPNDVLFRDDIDKVRFKQDLAVVQERTKVRVLAFAILDNHFHLMIQIGDVGLSEFMQQLDTRYSIHFNRRHHRRGPALWGRFGSKLVQYENYLLVGIRYVNRNPLAAGLVGSLADLTHYPYASVGCVVGVTRDDFVDVDAVRSLFGRPANAINAFLNWMEQTSEDDELFNEHRRAQKNEYGIIGTNAYRERAIRVDNERTLLKIRLQLRGWTTERIMIWVCRTTGADPALVRAGVRTRRYSEVRAAVIYLAVTELGVSLTDAGRQTGVTVQSASLALHRGAEAVRSYRLAFRAEALAAEVLTLPE